MNQEFHVLCADSTRHTTHPLPGINSAETFAALLNIAEPECSPHRIDPPTPTPPRSYLMEVQGEAPKLVTEPKKGCPYCGSLTGCGTSYGRPCGD